MIPFTSNSGRQRILQDFITRVRGAGSNLYLVYSRDTIDRETDETQGLINAVPSSITNPQFAVRIDNNIKYATQINEGSTGVRNQWGASVTESTIGALSFYVTVPDDLTPEMITTNEQGVYFTTLYHRTEVFLPNNYIYNKVTLVTDLKRGSSIIKDNYITSFSDINFSGCSIVMQAKPRNTQLSLGNIWVPVAVTF